MTKADFIGLLPLLTMTLGAIVLLVWDLFQGKGKLPVPRLYIGCFFSLFTMFLCVILFLTRTELGFQREILGGLLYFDLFALVLNMIILGGVFFTFLMSDEQYEPQRVKPSIDIDVLILLATIGAMVMVAAADLIVLFLGFELLSVSVYALTGLARGEKASAEGSLKYFVLGAFSSAFLLYGMALVYAATGSMNLEVIGSKAMLENPLLMFGLGLMIFGFGFKVSLVPFHFWTPDVYQGAPTSIAGFMAVVVKAAAFGAFFRVMIMGFSGVEERWVALLWALCVVTMTVGNVLALRQNSIKRMLAYSSIAHAGYGLIGFVALGSSDGGAAMVFYLMAYALMTLGAFGVVLLASGGSPRQYDQDDVQSLAGLGWTHPFLGICMVIAMLSLAGMPPLAGFIGKFYLFKAAVTAGFPGLAIIAALNSVVSLYYYLRVLVVMYFSERRSDDWVPAKRMVLGPRIALSMVTVLTVYLGLFSWRYFAAAHLAVESLQQVTIAQF